MRLLATSTTVLMAASLAIFACGDSSNLCQADGSGCACEDDSDCASNLHCYNGRCLPDDETTGDATTSTGTSAGTAETTDDSETSTTSSDTTDGTTGGVVDQTVCHDLNEPVEPGQFAGIEDTIELPGGAAIAAVRVEIVARTSDASEMNASLAGAQRITSLNDGGHCKDGVDIVATFDQTATNGLADSCQSGITGTVQPDGDLSVFHGRDLKGPWTLRVRDEKPTDEPSLVLERWCLHVDVQQTPADTDPTKGDAIWLRPKSLGDAGKRIHSTWGYDPGRDVVVAYGGCSQVSSPFICHAANQKLTAEWDGERWQDIDTTEHPGSIGHHAAAMSYDHVNDRLVLFGGYLNQSGYEPNAETWAYDGSNWEQLAPPQSPPARARHTMVWDPVNSQIVLFGGHDQSNQTVYDDVWAFDGTSWQQLPSTGGPGPLHTHAAAWHSGRDEMFVFGGFETVNFPQQVGSTQLWSYSPSTGQWQQHADAPVGVGASQIAYDQIRDKLVMFGGRDGALGTSVYETFEWNGATWTADIKPVWFPDARFAHGMMWLPARGVAFLYGGYFSRAARDTWYYTPVP